jgi:dihydrofolate reductase
MRKLIEYVLASADGVTEDPVAMGVGSHQNDAYLRDGLGLLEACDAVLFGRHIYEGFAALYGGGGTHKPMWADRLNEIPKYVFSSTLEKATWGNSTIIRGDVVAEVEKLKNEDGRSLLVLGHGLLGETLLREQLIDVIDLAIYPLLMGSGTQFYFRAGQHAKLRLAAVKAFSHVVKLTYEVER